MEQEIVKDDCPAWKPDVQSMVRAEAYFVGEGAD